jgi:glycosyltransferase involved in cell wall biosynthesis
MTATKLRVAHLGNYNPDSADGTEKTVAGLVAWSPNYGVEAEVWQLVPGLPGPRERLVDGRVRVFDLPAYAHPANYLRGLHPAARDFVRARQRRIDLVHFHSAFIPENSAVAALLGVPYVVTPNGSYSVAILRGRLRWFKAIWLRLRERPYVRRATFLQAVSPGEAGALRALFPQQRVLFVPNALDPARLADPRQGEARQKDLLYLGRLAVRQKGLDAMVAGYARFLERSGDHQTRLLLVGPDYRNGRRHLQRLVQSLGIAGRVAFPGPAYVEQKWRYLRSAYAFLHTSRWDGLPFSVLEALASGCPVLVTPESNVGEAVQRYGAGVVVPGAAADSVAAGIGDLVAAPAERHAAMTAGARRLVHDHFTWPEAARRVVQAYLDVCAPRRPA